MVFMEMEQYKGIKVHGFQPGMNGGITVRYTVMFGSSSSASEESVHRYLMQKIDDNGQLIGTTFEASIEMTG